MIVYFIFVCISVVFLFNLTTGLEETVCGGLDIRNAPSHFLNSYDPQYLKKYNTCTVIEGDVRLILMTNDTVTPEDFHALRFPKVREITGSLMVFQVVSLRSLEYLFPELRIIRGSNLVHNYALVLFQNPHLREVGLPKLTEISRGGVRIVDNNELCYADTVNWTAICRDGYTPPFIENNQNPNSCADKCFQHGAYCAKRYENKKPVTACWNYDTCQQTCPDECRSSHRACNYSIPGICCHQECVGGCSGPSAAECYACRHVNFKGVCKSQCPTDYYQLFDRRCVTKRDCDNRKGIIDENNEEIFYKALKFRGTCELKCPIGYEENPKDKRECLQCSISGCTQKCVGQVILSLSDAAHVKGCNIMNGALDITMHSGLSGNVIEKLEEYLGSLREVRDFVKISFTPSVVSLSMLKNLQVIRGEKLWNDKYALSVFENVNLAQLWNFTSGKERLQIMRGTLQFQNNPQLCYRTIMSMVSAINLVDGVAISEHDVSFVSNGNKAVCEELEIGLKLVYVTSDSVVVNWEEFNTTMMDHRMFLGYQMYYRAVDSESINIFENRDACSDSWQMVFYDIEERGALLTGLKPFTLYAFYVRTLMVNSPGAKGGISKVIFIRTKFDYPSQVILTRVESQSPDSIYLEWLPPLLPNGEVTHYMVTFVPKHDNLPLERNYCDEPPSYNTNDDKPFGFGLDHDTISYKPGNRWQSGVSSTDSNTCTQNKCCDCVGAAGNGSIKAPDDDVVRERAAFENIIHNIVFVNNRCIKRGTNKAICPDDHSELVQSKSVVNRRRKKRSIVDSYDSKKKKQWIVDAPSSTSISAYVVKSANFTRNAAADHHDFNFTIDAIEVDQQTPGIVNVTGFNHTLTVLRHFTSYEIRIWACQNRSVTENYCSRSEVMRMKRTQLIETKDAINESTIVVVNFTAESLLDRRLIRWDPPEDPNGIIVAYEVEYTRESSSTKAVKRPCLLVSKYRADHGIWLDDLHPGNYSLIIRASSLAQRGPWTKKIYFYISEPHNMREMIVIGVSIGISALVICVILFCVIFGYRRKYKKKLPEYISQFFSANPEYISQLEVYKPDQWELKRDDIEILREIGRGTFGTVFEGRGKNVVSVCGVKFGNSAIKTVGEKATIYDRWHFLIEASVMKQFSTAHIVKLYGVVSEGQPALVVMELMQKGSLKEYLTSRRPTSEENIHGLSPPTLKEVFQMAGEIADGMAYLEALKFCHRDLAARNCMVAADGTCKIGDFGMARDVYIKDYYRPLGRRLMPVRWMAPEALKDAVFTSKSDVWSYGVILWEIATLASQPYPGLSNLEVFGYVVDDHQTMVSPTGCPERLYDLMASCWQYEAKLRPSFAEIVGLLLPDMNDIFTKISYYCSQRGREQPLRSNFAAPIVKLSPTAVTAKIASNDSTGGSDCSDPGAPLNGDVDKNLTKRHRGSSAGNDTEHGEPICNNNRRTGFLSRFRRNTHDSSTSKDKRPNGTTMVANGDLAVA